MMIADIIILIIGDVISSDCVKFNDWAISFVKPLLSTVARKQNPAKRCIKIRKRGDLSHLLFESLLFSLIKLLPA